LTSGAKAPLYVPLSARLKPCPPNGRIFQRGLKLGPSDDLVFQLGLKLGPSDDFVFQLGLEAWTACVRCLRIFPARRPLFGARGYTPYVFGKSVEPIWNEMVTNLWETGVRKSF